MNRYTENLLLILIVGIIFCISHAINGFFIDFKKKYLHNDRFVLSFDLIYILILIIILFIVIYIFQRDIDVKKFIY